MKPTAAAAAFSAHHKETAPAPTLSRATPMEPVMAGRFASFVASLWFRNFIIGVIIASAILMGLQTTAWAKTGSAKPVIDVLDWLITAIFVVELCMKLVVFRARFFRDGWNIFDFLIVVISLLPATQELKVVRTLRVLRVLRLLSAIPSMRVVISGLLRAIPGMLSAIALLLIVIYVFAILSHQLFGADCFPGYLDRCEAYFDSLPNALFTLFQIMTLESWSHGIVRPIAEVYPWARWFFVLYVTVTAFAALNLFIGVVVNAMDSAQSIDKDVEDGKLESIQAELAEIKALLGAKPSGSTER